MVTLEGPVPADHLLRKIGAAIDFGFIRNLTEGLYCPDDCHPPIQGLEERGVLGVTGYLRPGGRKDMLRKRDFEYDHDADAYRCPEGQALTYATTDRQGYLDHKAKTPPKMTGFVSGLRARPSVFQGSASGSSARLILEGTGTGRRVSRSTQTWTKRPTAAGTSISRRNRPIS